MLPSRVLRVCSAQPRWVSCGIPSTWQRPTARRPGGSPRRNRRPTSCSSAPGTSCGSPSGRSTGCHTRPSRRPARPARAPLLTLTAGTRLLAAVPFANAIYPTGVLAADCGRRTAERRLASSSLLGAKVELVADHTGRSRKAGSTTLVRRTENGEDSAARESRRPPSCTACNCGAHARDVGACRPERCP